MNSQDLVPSIAPTLDQGYDGFRQAYLSNWSAVDAPTVAVSDVVPGPLVEHLMRHKKNMAIGVKFQSGGSDAITNMEGAMHTLLIPLVQALIQGDYQFHGRHEVPRFEPQLRFGAKQLARPIVVSALVQPDFENTQVMFELIKLEKAPFVGEDLPPNWKPLSIEQKQDDGLRAKYDESLKSYLIFRLNIGVLPSLNDVKAMDESQVLELLDSTTDLYLKSEGHTLSIKFLYQMMLLQVYVELRGLDDVCRNGYVYTWDPPVIFARTVGSRLLNDLWCRAMISALELAGTNMRALAFNDFSDKAVIPRLCTQVKAPVISKKSLFEGPNNTYSSRYDGTLVLHNNSDAFGQNVQFESAWGSLDGAIGSSSSAAASLLRERDDLLDNTSLYIYEA